MTAGNAHVPPTMTCGRARRLLWSGNGLRILSPELLQARAHVDDCADCLAFSREMHVWRDIVRAADSRETASAETRERLFSAIARNRMNADRSASMRRRSLPAAAVAAAFLLTIGLGIVWQLQRTAAPASATLLAALADDHARSAAGDGLRSSDRAQVTRWLAERVSFPLFVPTFDGIDLAGARLHVRDGRRAAVVEYTAGDRTVSYFIVPIRGDGALATPPGPAEGEREGTFHHMAHAGYGVVFWVHGDVMHAFVGNLHPTGLERLARSCVEQARAAMRAMAVLKR
jgi:hypothetical protein